MAKHSRNIFNDKRFFYIALAVCMLALGSASASMLKSYRTVQMQEDTSSSDYSGNGAQRTGEAVENLPYSEADEQGTAAGKSDGSAENGSQNGAQNGSGGQSASDGENGRSNEQSADGNQPADSKQSSQTSQNGQTNENGQIGGTRYFILPVGGKILKDYDDRNLQYSETYKDWRLHLALDIAANKGTAVFSAAKGTVEDIYEDSLLGTVVKINHGSGLTAYYCGLNSSPSVKKGEQIDGGYQIGAIAEIPCESVEENHLHLIMEQDGKPVSPLKVMEMKD